MRLQLVVLLAALFIGLVPDPVSAQEQDRAPWSGEAVSRYQLYTDDDETTVSTAIVDASTQLPGELQLGAHVLIDVVSSASVDVVSAATKRWTETRTEIGATASKSIANVDLGIGYVRSQEEDWSSHALQIGAGRDFFQRNLRIEASYGLVLNQIGRASDPVFEESMQAHQAELGISQLLDRETRVGASYGLQRVQGYQASPYRYVLASDGSRMPETHPDRRLRQSASGFVLRSLAEWLSLRGSYRFYWDDWGLHSHAGELSLRLVVSDSWRATVGTRLYQQRDAEFYRKNYQTTLRHMTGDRELSRFWDLGSSASMGTRLGPVHLDAKVELIHYEFKNFEALSSRLALVTGAGASLPW